MNRIALVLGLVAWSISAWGEVMPLNVMSFNLRYGLAQDGENSWLHRKDILVNAIREYEPDLLGTQECLEFQADYLAENLADYRWFGMGRDGDRISEQMAVFYRKDVLCPLRSGHFWLSETPDVVGSRSWNTACTRMVTWAEFFNLKTRQRFFYFNTHFDHVSEAARQASARLLLERVNQTAGEVPCIVTGDFNSVGGASEPWRILTDGGLRDSWMVAEERIGPSHTDGVYSAPQPGKDCRIDWILVRGPVAVSRCETVIYNENGRYPSDHYAVFAEMRLFVDDK
ncbi:MAG TPA: endonuclease/exonuclease/phosphatase family protein [Candidatus Hydrogenedentes bacterium]|nr:endonuclease/exonuclease/phosphatase family protein [Candidatus Hydrogenedentota bacterium]HPG68015.1 endonuclease/exonuclease/phosphatase family protein [Candidatus Hydrogenedentota bacterium]